MAHNREAQTVNWYFSPPKFQCFNSQSALHGLRALEFPTFWYPFVFGTRLGTAQESLAKFAWKLLRTIPLGFLQKPFQEKQARKS